LSLQFSLQFIEEAPVGSLRDDLLRAGLDHAHFMQSQCMKAYRIFRVCLTPAIVRQALEHLEPNLVARFVTASAQHGCDALWFTCADDGGFEKRTDGPLGGYR